MERLQIIANEATKDINSVLNAPLSDDQTEKIRKIIETTVIKALLEGQHRAVDAALQCPEAEQDMAHKFAAAIRQKNDLLIVNLTSMR
ncbi:MAG: hypothetical protein K8F25_16385 [Fimbriimonadaceae bacterium]|nr:hypothetical protein [Alphaproteobacteria bacterium]